MMNDEFGETRYQGLESRLLIREQSISDSHLAGDARADYLLIKFIGESGMCTVWHATQASTGRDLAIKVFNARDHFNQNARDVFLRQALITADLDHPNIVPVYDLGRSESNELFCTMRLFQGQRWDQLIGITTLEENLEIWLKVADAIAFAHFRGVVHCDIKPSRVVVGSFGEVQVTDFGLAIVLSNFRHFALLNELAMRSIGMGGTPSYMAPEQAAGDGLKISPLSDVYLLGAILFEMIVGVPPHQVRAEDGKSPSALVAMKNAAANKIVQTNKSNELLDIALKAMKTSPEDRYPSMKVFIKAVKDCQKHSKSIQHVTPLDKNPGDGDSGNISENAVIRFLRRWM